MKLILATNNKHKINEIKKILGNYFPCILSMKDVGLDIEIEETGNTFEENAFIKAETISRMTGMIALADDSGLSVDCLNGAPGVYSARYAGDEHDDEKNIDKLLDVMKEETNRNAKFITVLALICPDGRKFMAEGKTFGEITTKRKGNGGFGYDPIFYSYELNKTFGESTEEEKNLVSHRKKALENLKTILRGINL